MLAFINLVSPHYGPVRQLANVNVGCDSSITLALNGACGKAHGALLLLLFIFKLMR